LRYISPRLNQKRMKIIVFAKKFSASSCNIFITFQMFKADIWFFGFFRKFQPNYFWSKMFSRYGCLKILFTNVKIPCKVDTSHHYILFSAGARSSCLLDRPFSKGLFTPPRRSLKTEVSLWKRFKCFPSTLRRRNFYKRPNNHQPFWICVSEKNSGREIAWLSRGHRFQKAPFSNVLRPHEN